MKDNVAFSNEKLREMCLEKGITNPGQLARAEMIVKLGLDKVEAVQSGKAAKHVDAKEESEDKHEKSKKSKGGLF